MARPLLLGGKTSAIDPMPAPLRNNAGKAAQGMVTVDKL